MYQQEPSGRLVSIQVGIPTTCGQAEPEGAWSTGFFKRPVAGPVQVGQLNLEGDAQADLKHHGGPDKAVLAYSADHYATWQAELAWNDMSYGAFGENLTIRHVDETQVCIGDLWQIGDVVLQVSQPREPCWKLGRRWNNKLLPKLVVKSGRCGWYYRVRQTGTIQADLRVDLVERTHAAWTIARAHRVRYGSSRQDKRALSGLSGLSKAWREELAA